MHKRCLQFQQLGIPFCLETKGFTSCLLKCKYPWEAEHLGLFLDNMLKKIQFNSVIFSSLDSNLIHLSSY